MDLQQQTINAAQLAAIASQLSELVASQSQPCMTFGDLFDIYYEKHAKARNKAPENAKYFFQRHAIKYAQTPVNALTQRDLQEWVDAIGRERGSSGAKRAIDMLSAVISWGMRRGYVNIYANPCKVVERHASRARSRFLKPQELARLADALRDEPTLWRDFVWVCLFTGARRGNIAAMRWEQIDFDLGQWVIPDSKNGDELVIALTRPAVALLQRRKSEATDSPWVFPAANKTGHVNNFKRMWTRVCRRAELSDARIHDLRRTMASYMAINGASSYQIGKALGHRDPRSTAIYARLDLTGVRGEMEKVHESWIAHCLKGVPQPTRRLIDTCSSEVTGSQHKNATIKLDARQQVIVEARIIVAMQHGAATKKELYRKIGGKIQINARELDRILNEMETRGITESYQDNSSVRHWQHRRYRLVG